MALDMGRSLPGGRCGVSKAYRGEVRVCCAGPCLQLHGPRHRGERTLGDSRPPRALRGLGRPHLVGSTAWAPWGQQLWR